MTLHDYLLKCIEDENDKQNTLNLSNNDAAPDEETYRPPPVPDNMFSSSESEMSDTPDYLLESSEDENDEQNVPQIRLPLKNYSRDTEDYDDFENNWLWLFEDTGASYGPFTGMPGMNIQPNGLDPLTYFELFFDPAMYTTIAGQTNQYARQRYQTLTGDFPFIILDNYSIFTR